MTPVFADTFYYLAFLHRGDAAHDRAMALSAGLTAPIITTTWVLTEVADGAAAVGRRSSFQQLYEALRTDRALTIVPPSLGLFEGGLAFYFRHRDKDWSLTDCISFVVMKKRGPRDALTGDRHFEQAGFRALLR